MQPTKAVALIVVALVLGFVVGFKSGKSSGTAVQAGAICPTPPPTSPTAEASAATAPAKTAPAAQTGGALPRLVDLGSTTCIPCKQMAPILEELKNEYKGKVDVQFIDVNTSLTAADDYKINVIPTQVFITGDGKEVFRHEGFFPKADILAQFEKMGIKTR